MKTTIIALAAVAACFFVGQGSAQAAPVGRPALDAAATQIEPVAQGCGRGRFYSLRLRRCVRF